MDAAAGFALAREGRLPKVAPLLVGPTFHWEGGNRPIVGVRAPEVNRDRLVRLCRSDIRPGEVLANGNAQTAESRCHQSAF